ncbi:MAG: NAD(P)H-dependent oxidoreductase [Marinilabiliales bacterium]|nr:NAD(P)H-dependent oxidoreductase [Marinilabiliales bacterium]
MSLISQLNKRYATKKFDPNKTVSEATFENLLEAIRLSASSYGLQAYKVLVVEDKAIRQKLREAAWGQTQITDASHLLVFAIQKNFNEADVDKFVEIVANVRGMEASALSGYADMMKGSFKRPVAEIRNWLTKQAYIALGFGLVAAAELDVDACPMEGFSTDQFDEILGLDAKGLSSVVVLTVGYRAEDDGYQHLAKVRRSKDELFERI